MNTKRTGLVCTVEAVPEGHQIGIIWTTNGEGLEIGFVYDEDATPPKDIPSKVEKYCADNGFAVAAHLAGSGWTESARVEEVSEDLFIDWFGGKPRSAGLFFDGFGKADDHEKAYGVPDGFASPAMAESRKRSRIAGLKAGGVTAGIMAAGAAVFVAACFVLAGDMPVGLTMYAVGGTVLAVLGAVLLIEEAQRISRKLYRKFI